MGSFQSLKNKFQVSKDRMRETETQEVFPLNNENLTTGIFLSD